MIPNVNNHLNYYFDCNSVTISVEFLDTSPKTYTTTVFRIAGILSGMGAI